MSSMRLGALLQSMSGTSAEVLAPAWSAQESWESVEISSITQDSRTVRPGALFCAIRGTVDGHDYVVEAVERGAVAVVVERSTGTNVPEIVVSDVRLATGYISAAFERNPSDELDLIGVTGTNGKTSIVTLIEHLVNFGGGVAASMGTLTGSLTTLSAPDFQAELRRHRDLGVGVVAAEISSHALDQKRVVGSHIRVAVFSNLSQDHLDYHADMNEYFEAKTKLFTGGFAEAAVIDVSDRWGERLVERCAYEQPALHVVAIDGGATADGADLGPHSSRFMWRGHSIDLPLGGRFSVKNALLAAETCVLLGYAPQTLADGLAQAPQIPGRFESIEAGQPFGVVVDYSHTPGSVEAAVASARDLTNSRVLLVFGAAGDRDPGKRPLMGAAAGNADVLYVTSDNPRTEDPEMIIDDVMAGITNADVHRIVDRTDAIRTAISDARPGDVVVIAGKGHEDYQIIGATRHDFDDRIEARAALAALGWESAA
jgi:UDP-N-acetylmuramoyl-L-alanyl-D-glutamate--2,6-diaminopimelate ligase